MRFYADMRIWGELYPRDSWFLPKPGHQILNCVAFFWALPDRIPGASVETFWYIFDARMVA